MARIRVARILAVVGFAVVLAACNVNTKVVVTLRPDGTGTIRTVIVFDADAVSKMGGAATLVQTVPLDDLRAAGWTISHWTRGTGGTESITLSHGFFDQTELAQRVVDLAGPHGILQSPQLTHDRGWFRSHDGLAIVVDVRSPSVDIVSDKALSDRLRFAGTDPAKLQAQLAVQLKTALHVSVALQVPGRATKTYDAPTGSRQTFRVSHGGLSWDHVVKFGIGVALALLAVLFFLAAGIGIRRNRRRAAQRSDRSIPPERTPLM
jgi:hypothetical protein